MRGLAVVESSANAEGRKNCRAARRSSTSRRGPLPAGSQALAGRPGVLHGRQRRSKMNTPAQHPSRPTPRFQHPPGARSPFGPSGRGSALAPAYLYCTPLTVRRSRSRSHRGAAHPGVLVAKVGYFGVKSAKVCRAQMGTKPAKVGRLGPRCAKVRRGPHPAPTGASAKRSSIHAASKVAKVGAAGGPKLLKWGRLRARQGQIC